LKPIGWEKLIFQSFLNPFFYFTIILMDDLQNDVYEFIVLNEHKDFQLAWSWYRASFGWNYKIRRKRQLIKYILREDLLSSFPLKPLITLAIYCLWVKRCDRALVNSILARLHHENREDIIEVFEEVFTLVTKVPDNYCMVTRDFLPFLFIFALIFEQEIRIAGTEQCTEMKVSFDKAIIDIKKSVSLFKLQLSLPTIDLSFFPLMGLNQQTVIKTLFIIRNNPLSILSVIPNELMLMILSYIDMPEEAKIEGNISKRCSSEKCISSACVFQCSIEEYINIINSFALQPSKSLIKPANLLIFGKATFLFIRCLANVFSFLSLSNILLALKLFAFLAIFFLELFLICFSSLYLL
jgi:hypothetical protein